MDKKELEQRTKAFAVSVVNFVESLPKNKTSDVLGYQLLKSGTSVGAIYREANRAQSRADLVDKIAIVEKEIGETQYWLELFDEVRRGDDKARDGLLQEAAHLLRIFIAMGKSTKENGRKSPPGTDESEPLDPTNLEPPDPESEI
jgi:four helix bundle protein